MSAIYGVKVRLKAAQSHPAGYRRVWAYLTPTGGSNRSPEKAARFPTERAAWAQVEEIRKLNGSYDWEVVVLERTKPPEMDPRLATILELIAQMSSQD